MARKRVAAAVMIAMILDDDDEKRPKRGKTRNWIRRREEKGAFCNMVNELGIEDSAGFKEMMRMDYGTFVNLLSFIEKDIQWSPAISNFHRVKQKVRDSGIFEIAKFEIAGSHLEKFEIARFYKFYKLGSQTLTKANA